MNQVQALRVFSILSGLMVGFWLPLKLISFSPLSHMDLIVDSFISIAAAVNLYLHFKRPEKSYKNKRDWMKLSVLTDVICLLPLMFIEDFFFNGANKGLVFLNLFAARHFWRVKDFLDEFDNLKPIVYRLVPIALLMPMLVHMLACGWIALGSGNAENAGDNLDTYVKAFYWAMTTLTTVGYGDISAKTHGQMFYAAMTQLVGVGVFGFVLSNVASLLSRLDAARESHMDNLDQIESFMSSYRIPVSLRSKVRSYYHYMWKEHRGRLDRSIISTLPLKLQSELNFSINHSIISHVSFLKNASKEMLYDMMLALDHRVYVPGERIFKVGEEANCLYLIHSGTVEIISSEGQHIATLHQGAVFGEMALIAEGPRSASARATNYCDLYLLPKADFKRIINSYPDFHAHLQEIMKARRQASAESATKKH